MLTIEIMITVDEARKAYATTGLKPAICGYVEATTMQAHPLGAIVTMRGLPVSSVYEYFGPSFVDDFNVGFYDLNPILAYSEETYELGCTFRQAVLDGSLAGEMVNA